MFKVNDDYLKLPGSYLFSTIGKKVAAFQEANPDQDIIRLGIGDVTQPLAPAIIDALHGAVDEMAHAETFHGYAPDLGYEFLRSAMAKNDYQDKGCDIKADEIFISDGAKCDSGNIQEIFAKDNKIAVCDPVYPVYVDTNVMAGRTGVYDQKAETWSDVIYMPCTKETGFAPQLPKETPDIIYLCFPNNLPDLPLPRLSCRNGWTMPIRRAQSSSMTRPMKHTLVKRTCRIPSMSVKAQEPVRLSFEASPRMPDSQA